MAENVFNILEMRKKRAALVKQAREILDKADKEKRSLTAEEEEKYEKIFAEVDEIGKRIEKEERQREMENEIEKSKGPAAGKEELSDTEKKQKEEIRAAFRKYLVGGVNALTPEEVRVLSVSDPTLGGYMVAPEEFVAELIKGVDDAVYIRKYATIHQLKKSVSLGAPALDSDMDDFEWTTELATGSEDTSMKIGKRELKPNPIAKRVKVSNTLLRVSAIDPERLVRERLQYKYSGTLEKAYLTGDGNNKALGLFVASSDGISTNRDVVCGTATAITADGLIDVKYALKKGYRRKAVWIFHRDVLKQIRKLKDGQGQYIWQPGLKGNAPDTLLNSPILESEFAPNTFSANQYVVLYGDLSYYWIVDSLDFVIQRLVELYAEKNQTGFIGRYEGDGMPVLEEAFARGKLASE